MSVPVQAVVGLAGIGSKDCTLHDLGVVEEQDESEQ
jgi:hypothetical protein